MVCSASKLSRTRSGTVSSRFLVDICSLALAAPIPPLALFGRQQRIAGLRNRGGENILAADVHALAGDAAELLIKPLRILLCQLLNATNAQQPEISQHGRTH